MKPIADPGDSSEEKPVRPRRVGVNSPAGQPASSAPPDHAFAFDEISEAARFPGENPNPVFRVTADGRLLYANRASRPLLDTWNVAADACLPSPWRERIAGVLAAGVAQKWDAGCDEQVLQLHCVPIVEGGYVNVYASDVTERVALLTQLTEEQHRLAESVRIAEQRAAELEATLDAISDGVVIYGHDGRIVRHNAAAGLLGLQQSDENLPMAGRRARLRAELVSDPSAGVEQMPVARALRGETVRGELMRFFPLDGSGSDARYVLASAAPICDRTGVSLGAVASFSDVTELRRARDELEQRVQERTAELEAIFASAPDALYVMNEQGIVSANQAALQSFGVDRVEELRDIAGSLAERMQARNADTGRPLAREELSISRALRGERAVHEGISHNPRTGRDQIHRVAAAPIVLNGEIVGAVGIATDITEQKRAHQQLAYQANLLENVNDAIFAYDADFRITAWNRRAEEQYGWTAEQAVGAHAPQMVGSRMPAEEHAAALRILAATGRWNGEIRHTRRDGTPLIVEATSMALRGEDGRITGYVTVIRDVTERREAEAQKARLLEELSASREQLRALSRRLVAAQESERSYVADQLYNQAGQVLAALQLQLACLRKEVDGQLPAGQLPMMQATLKEAIRELHDLARQLRPVGLDRSTLARVLEAHVAAFGKGHGVRVQFSAGNAEALRPPTDVGTAVFRAVQEGLANVARHARATVVTLSMSQDAGILTVELTDNGVGFDPTASLALGGLGLASIRERLTSVGGQVTIETGMAGTCLRMQAPLGNEEP